MKFLFSTRLMAILFVSFALSMGIGTFIESFYNTTTARIWIYNTRWFEFIVILFTVNFLGNIKRYRLFRKEKLAVLGVHLSFFLIILGAFVTRYISYEGVMSIREGATADSFLSEKTYLTIMVDGTVDGKEIRRTLKKKLLIAEATDNDFELSYEHNGVPYQITYRDYYENAHEDIISDADGQPYLKIVESSEGQRHDHFIKQGDIVNMHNTLITYDKPTEGAINIQTKDGLVTINSPYEGNYMTMATQRKGLLNVAQEDTLHLRSLYQIGHLQFVIPAPPTKGKLGVIKSAQKQVGDQQALIVDIHYKNNTQTLQLMGGKGYSPAPTSVKIDDLQFHAIFGSEQYKLPFSITLKDFIADKYPGTENGYSSFKSKVTVNENGDSFDTDIYMNHILDHHGYRFFQASFDQDEQGTVLSVNHDFWGTWITYFGYFLLYASLMGILFYGKSHFRKLGEQLRTLRNHQFAWLIGILLISQLGWSQQHAHDLDSSQSIDSLLMVTAVPKEQASKFAKLVIQDDSGRMMPINTFASEFLRKISKKDMYKNLNADQVFLSISTNPFIWYQVPFVYLRRGNDSLRNIIGVPKKTKYAKMTDFFTDEGRYKLSPYLQEAYATNTPNQFQKDFKELDLRLGMLNRAISKDILRLYPIPNDANHKWISPLQQQEDNSKVKDSLYANFISNSITYYGYSLSQGQQTGSYDDADKILDAIQENQRKWSKDIIPTSEKIAIEILYNKFDIFKSLFSYYMYIGTLMFVLLIVSIFKKNKIVSSVTKYLGWVVIFLFVLHTLGLISRWYISGHAPWSDAYESMIYVAWATMGMGLLFSKKSQLTVASTAFVTSMILMVAHWNWLDPAIANLQPVLNSYWLMIHVAVIVASYGPFTLGMILGVVALILMIITNEENKKRTKLAIKEITIVNELSLTVGLVMLTIGNFLGGQWANESWGRYWGWDPKETWALISIMVYAFVIHMRLIPKMRGFFAFSLASIIAYASIMMTYFGVNFYLAGLHSYASGDKVVTPNFVYYSILFVFIIGVLAYRKRKFLK